ncbi:RNA-binding domain-containing protein [Heliobacterium mobile]|uniref:RNA-binding domain-containing protein n=1 Tax=Heliobacterium mobile TaxID=28064 RepID=UPI0012D80959|nr:RNA-binding domain-containing protein [Heliobacterium mobile]
MDRFEFRKNLSSEYLIDLLKSQHEDVSLDFKEEHDLEWVELVKDVMAFANTEGGHIVFGVKEDKEKKSFSPVGVSDSFSINDITLRSKLEKYLNTAPEIGVSHHTIDGRRYPLIYIVKAPRPISAIKDGHKNGQKKAVFSAGDIYHRQTSESTPVKDIDKLLTRYIDSKDNFQSKQVLNNLPFVPVYRSKNQFIGRSKELNDLRAYVEKEPGTLSILVDGLGGVGKTSLAQFYAYEILENTKAGKSGIVVDFIVWVSAKDEELTEQGRIKKEPELKTLEDLFQTVAYVTGFEEELLAEQTYESRFSFTVDLLNSLNGGLLFLDNLETFYDPRLLNFLAKLNHKTKTIITSRHKLLDNLRLPVNRILEVQKMTGETGGRELVTTWAENLGLKNIASMNNNAKDDFVEKAFGLPLLIINTLNDIANGLSLQDAVNGLKTLNIDSDLLEFQFHRSFKYLPENQKRVYFSLSFFIEPQSKKTISAVSGIEGIDLDNSIFTLVSRRLLIQEVPLDVSSEPLYTMEPLSRTYAQEHLKADPKIEQELRSAYHDFMIITEKNVGILLKPAFSHGFKFSTPEENNAAAYASEATRIWKTRRSFEDAQDKFKKAEILAPKLGYIYSQWAWVCEQSELSEYGEKQKSRLEEANSNFIKACQFDENNIRIWYQRGMFEIRRRDPDSAQPCFERGLECPGQADDPRCWHGIGRCYTIRATQITKTTGHRAADNFNREAKRMFEKGFISRPQSKADITHNAQNWYYLSLSLYHLAKTNSDYQRIKHAINQGLELDPINTHLMKLLDEVERQIRTK